MVFATVAIQIIVFVKSDGANASKQWNWYILKEALALFCSRVQLDDVTDVVSNVKFSKVYFLGGRNRSWFVVNLKGTLANSACLFGFGTGVFRHAQRFPK